jgi:DNA polymerase-3 subunit epsilon
MNTFAAIDFETANYSADSACALGVVIVKGGRIVRREHHLIRPPTRDFVFTHIHGLTWQDVRSAPTFAEVWADLRQLLQGVTFLAAHNARFDRNVLSACCHSYRLRSSLSLSCPPSRSRVAFRAFSRPSCRTSAGI